MNVPRAVIAGAAVLSFIAVAAPRAVLVPQSDIDAENAHYASLGLTLPKGGIVLEDPYDPPYSNRSFVVPRSWVNFGSPDPNPPIVASSLRADLPTLRFIMEKTYAGWQTAAARGWDWDAWFRAWDRELESSGDRTITLRAALDPWNALEDFQPDNHTHPMLLGFTGVSLSATLATAPSGACTALTTTSGRDMRLSPADAAQQPHAVQAWDGQRLSAAWYVAYPDRYGTLSSITCGGQTIAAMMAAQPKVAAVKPFYSDLGDGIAYIRTPFSFSYRNDDALRQLLAREPGMGKERAVLLDLRGNGGGAMPIDVLAPWFTPKQFSSLKAPFGFRYSTRSCFTTALWFNLGQIMSGGLEAPLSDDTKTLLQAQLDGLGDNSPNACAVKPHVTHGDRTLLQHHFAANPSDPHRTRVVAIVDNECGSDCEGMAITLARLPDTVIAGTSTAGTIGFTQPGMLVLPHSRLNFMIATSRGDVYGDGRSEASYGITVDVLLPTGESQDLRSLTALARALVTTSPEK